MGLRQRWFDLTHPAQRRLLDDTAALLGGTRDRAVVTAAVDGVPVRLELSDTTFGDGNTIRVITIDAPLPAGYPLLLHVRRRKARDHRRVASGELIAVPLGDAAFDRAFLVEGAPAVVVRALLDDALRALITAGRRAELVAAEHGVRLTIEEHPETCDRAKALVEVVVAFGRRLREATLALDAVVPVDVEGAPFREAAADRQLREARAARAAEVERLRALRARR